MVLEWVSWGLLVYTAVKADNHLIDGTYVPVTYALLDL